MLTDVAVARVVDDNLTHWGVPLPQDVVNVTELPSQTVKTLPPVLAPAGKLVIPPVIFAEGAALTVRLRVGLLAVQPLASVIATE